MEKSLNRFFGGLGLFLAVAGVFIIIIQPLAPTGAVIDISSAPSKISFFLGLAMIIGGILLHTLAIEKEPIAPITIVPMASKSGKNSEISKTRIYRDKIAECIRLFKPYANVTHKSLIFHLVGPFINWVLESARNLLSEDEKQRKLEELKRTYRKEVDEFNNQIKTRERRIDFNKEIRRLEEMHDRGKGIIPTYMAIKRDLKKNYGQGEDADAKFIAYAIYDIFNKKQEDRRIILDNSNLQDIIDVMKTGYEGIDPKTGQLIELKKLKEIANALTFMAP